jgi:hypothetical protein
MKCASTDDRREESSAGLIVLLPKIVFEGKGGATINQFNLHTEMANSVTRVVQYGSFIV